MNPLPETENEWNRVIVNLQISVVQPCVLNIQFYSWISKVDCHSNKF